MRRQRDIIRKKKNEERAAQLKRFNAVRLCSVRSLPTHTLTHHDGTCQTKAKKAAEVRAEAEAAAAASPVKPKLSQKEVRAYPHAIIIIMPPLLALITINPL